MAESSEHSSFSRENYENEIVNLLESELKLDEQIGPDKDNKSVENSDSEYQVLENPDKDIQSSDNSYDELKSFEDCEKNIESLSDSDKDIKSMNHSDLKIDDDSENSSEENWCVIEKIEVISISDSTESEIDVDIRCQFPSNISDSESDERKKVNNGSEDNVIQVSLDESINVECSSKFNENKIDEHTSEVVTETLSHEDQIEFDKINKKVEDLDDEESSSASNIESTSDSSSDSDSDSYSDSLSDSESGSDSVSDSASNSSSNSSSETSSISNYVPNFCPRDDLEIPENQAELASKQEPSFHMKEENITKNKETNAVDKKQPDDIQTQPSEENLILDSLINIEANRKMVSQKIASKSASTSSSITEESIDEITKRIEMEVLEIVPSICRVDEYIGKLTKYYDFIDKCMLIHLKYGKYEDIVLQNIKAKVNKFCSIYNKMCSSNINNIIEFMSFIEKCFIRSEKITTNVMELEQQLEGSFCRLRETIPEFGARVKRGGSLYAIAYKIKYRDELDKRYLNERQKTVFLRGLRNKKYIDTAKINSSDITFDELLKAIIDLGDKMPDQVPAKSNQGNSRSNLLFNRPRVLPPALITLNCMPNTCSFCKMKGHVVSGCLLKNTIQLCNSIMNMRLQS